MLTRLFDIVCHKCGAWEETEVNAVIDFDPATSRYLYMAVIHCPKCNAVEIISKEAKTKDGRNIEQNEAG
jgi:transcription elongation factor Elf1